MLLRRVAAAALAIAALCACEPGVGYDASRNPSQTNYAVFDPSASPPQIPLPNDLALTQAAAIPGAQGDLLKLFVSQGGFPNDQEVPITIDLVTIDSSGNQARSKPNLDVSSIRVCNGTTPNCNLAVLTLASSPALVAIDTPAASDYVTSGDHGTLTIRRSAHDVPLTPTTTTKSRTWDAGVHYVAAIRGGPKGVTVNGGQQISPQPAMFIIEQGKDLTKPENQGLIPGATAADRAAAAAQLDALRRQYEAGPFTVVSAMFPKTEIATMTTFQIAPPNPNVSSAHVVIDSGSGTAPLPFNALLDGATLPDDPLAPATNARVQNLPSTFGPLAPGIATLDGFSTTGMLLIPVSAPIIAATDPGPTSTFTGTSPATTAVFLYDITNPNAPTLVDPVTYDDLLPSQLLAPVPSTPFKASVLIGLQPAAASKLATSKPLKEASEYAVVVTNRVKGADAKGLGRSTVANVLLFSNPLWVNGKSQLAGISDPQAKALERMRAQIANLLGKLTSPPFTKTEIAAAYTFRTQTITTPALQLAAAPYDPSRSPGVNFVGTINAMDPGVAFAKYGIGATLAGQIGSNVLEIIEAKLPTPNLLSATTGAFDPTLLVPGANPPIDVIPALIVVPDPAKVTIPACPPPAGALKCAPLVVFHHGLNGSRGQMLLGANELAGKGFVVAAIDAPKHGDRAWCTSTTQCAAGTCQPIPGAASQGDATPPGLCKDANGNPTALRKAPIDPTCTGTCATGATEGTSVTSGAFVISGNLFRSRDTFRQDIIDNSGLILALARPPAPFPATTNPNPVAAELQAKGIVVDPKNVFWEGQSLGGILGTINTAANPRISEAVLNVPGGTFIDIATTSPAFASALDAVLATVPPPLGPITRGTPQFLQFLHVSKWVFDPAEPLNFAGRMIGDATHPTLVDLLAPPPPTGQPPALQAAKKVLGQMAVCDNVVPNPFNLLLFNVAGLPLNDPAATTGNQVNASTFFRNNATTAAGGFCVLPAPFEAGTVAHGFLLDHGAKNGGTNDGLLSQDARDQAADFLKNLTAQPGKVR